MPAARDLGKLWRRSIVQLFDGPVFLPLNVAIGGWTAPVGPPASNTPFPQHARRLRARVPAQRTNGKGQMKLSVRNWLLISARWMKFVVPRTF